MRGFVAVVFADPEDGGYVATVPAVPGVVGQGETEEEAYRDVEEALRLMLDYLEEEGREIPEEVTPAGSVSVKRLELAV